MTTHEHHSELMDVLTQQLQRVFEGSDQAVYVYMDDEHKVCNQNFSNLLGYASPDEWAAITESFPQAFVAQDSQHTLIETFQKAMQSMAASTFSVTWLKKDKQTVDTTVILVPISFEGHLFALHFITKK